MKKLVYIHVPKCGGSSFAAALRLRFLARQRAVPLDMPVPPGLSGEDLIEARYHARGAALERLMRQGHRCITGHVQATEERMRLGGYRWITLLRPPEARFVSHYAYLQRTHPDPARPDTLEAFVETEDAARLASQYLFYFSGRSQARCGDVSAATARAVGCLRRFDLVGDLAQPEAFHQALSALVGGGVLRLHRNAAPKPMEVAPHLRRRIEALCAPDRAIYDALCQQRVAA